MFAWHAVLPPQVGSRASKLDFLCVDVEFERPVRLSGQSEGFYPRVGAPCDFATVGSIMSDQQSSAKVGIGDVSGELSETLDDPFEVVLDVQMVFFNVQNGGMFGTMRME